MGRWLFLILILEYTAIGAGPQDAIELHTFKTHSRLSFKVDEGVEAVYRELPSGFEVFFKGAAIADFGAPLGNETAWIQKQQALKDEHLAHLKIEEHPQGVKILGKWKFATGEKAPANPVMEKFDYRDKKTGSYVVDFWPKNGPTLTESRALKLKKDREAALKKAEADAKKRQDRRVAAQKKIEEAEDVLKFCKLPLAEQKDVFLAFQPAHDPVKFGRWIATTTPDSNYNYPEVEGKEKDAQYMRLALELYRQGNLALALKTADFFDAEVKQSPYRAQMAFMRANALIKLSHKDEAEKVLNRLMTENKSSQEALYAGMYLAAKAADANAHLQALESFLWLIQNHSSNSIAWVFHLGAAEALYFLKQTERSSKEYQWIVENAPNVHNQAEAAFRMGDLYLDRQQYEQSLAAYYQSLRKYEQDSKDFPQFFLNRAETLYWLGQYERAEGEFAQFLTKYPNYPAGWRATFRLGEIYGRRAGKESQEQAQKWFYETVNRYPYSAGANIARLRLMPCGDHGGFTVETAQQYFEQDATKYDGDGQIFMDRYRDFKGLSHVRTLVSLGQEGKAVDVGIHELKTNTRTEAKQVIGGLLEIMFKKTLVKLLNEGKKYEALAFYRDRVSSMPKYSSENSLILDPDYLLKLSQAASDLGLGKMASQLAERYERENKQIEEQNRSLASANPEAKEKDVDLRIKDAQSQFTSAKALWIGSGIKEEAKIRDLLKNVVEESEFSYEREIILGLLEEKKDKLASALGHASKALILLPSPLASKNSDEGARISHWVGTLQARAGESKAALEIFRNLRKQKRDASTQTKEGVAALLGVPPVPNLETLLLAEGEILEKQERWGEAASTYGSALTDGQGSNHLMYQYARALGNSEEVADRKAAQAVLEKVAESKTEDFWKKLAKEALVSRNIAKEGKK